MTESITLDPERQQQAKAYARQRRRLMLFTLVFAAPTLVYSLPLDYYGGYILPHRYGQSNQTARSWLGDQLKGLVMGAIGLVVMPVSNGFSRWRERLADRYALEMTGNPQAFMDAMSRLANQNLADADPEPWVIFWLYSHPPIEQRVAAARAFCEPLSQAR